MNMTPQGLAWTVMVLVLAFVGVMVRRIFQVERYLKRVLERVSQRSDELIRQGDFGAWIPLFVSLQTVSFDEMCSKFWQPLPSFFDGTLIQAEGLLPDD